MATGTFRRVSVTEQSTFTSADHGAVVGNQGVIPRHTQKKAFNELNETEERKKKELKCLRNLMEKKLESADDSGREEIQLTYELFHKADDDVLIRFLRARKFNSERTWGLMKGYAGYRINYPDVAKMTQKEARMWVEKGQPGVLPKRDSKGRVIMFFQLETWDPEMLPFAKAMEVFAFVLEKLLENPETQINGVCIVEDFGGYTMGQAAAVGINEYKQMVDMLQGAFPCRFKGIFCIRQPWFFAKAYSIIKPLLKAKIFERIYIIGDELESFYNEFSKEYLPENLGGTAPPYDGRAVANMLFGTKEEAIEEDTAM